MVQAIRRTTIRGPALVRQLARLTATDVPQPRQSLSDQLSHWLDWNHALALSSALDSTPATNPDIKVVDAADAGECSLVRASLTQAIANDSAFAAPASGKTEQTAADEPLDAIFFRRRYLAMQQTMGRRIGNLRTRLRDRLATGSAEMARLAALDAVMERALGPRERKLLSAAPNMLITRFELLLEGARQTPEDAASPDDLVAPKPDAWLAVFRKDMQSLLLAELDVRLQPAEGLLAALRAL